ncbi:hypothetical protein ACF08M_25995 [Streptomyces sp. NPDC015032]|uniref:hypothetical protein n=1 Tax=Streptomyces sp. NPDC015032 TaxID=3364937 RepID=UPI0036FD86E3
MSVLKSALEHAVREEEILRNTLADSIETVQLSMGQELLEYARAATAPGAKTLSATEYRWLSRRLAEALTDALRVADSRGQRIPDQEEAAEDA